MADDDDTEKKGFALLLDTIYQEAFAYQSIKMMKIWDWRLTYMTRTFTLGTVVYALFYVILFHGYFQKELPYVSVDVKLDVNDLSLIYPNLTWVNDNSSTFDLLNVAPGDAFGKPVLSFPELRSYCAPRATDYVWDVNGTRSYVNNTCVPYYSGPEELTERGHQSVWLYTYWQQQHWARDCVDALDVPKYYVADPPGYPQMPDADKDLDFSDPGYVPNCGDVQLLEERSVLTLAPEKALNITIMGTYTTTWGRTRSVMATQVGPREGTTALDGMAPLEFAPTEAVTMNFETLLALAGINLDDPNELDDGGLGPANGTAWPRYRITGVTIVAEMKYNNFVENGTLDPFNFADHLSIRLYPATVGTFATAGTKLYYTGRNMPWGAREMYPYPDMLFTTRTPQGVQVMFKGAGEIGRFDLIVLISALVTIIVLSDFAQSITDITAGFLIDGFRAQKYMDDLELKIRLMLRSQLVDSPVPEQVRMFENETLEIYANRAYNASQMQRMKELEAAAAAEAARHGPLVGADKAEEEAPPEVDEPEAPLESRGAVLRSMHAGKTGTPEDSMVAVVPHVATLLIAGEPFHGTPLTAQGHLRNCRCVRFQWLRSRGGAPWEAIPFATLPTFFPTADDCGCLISVEATPVTDDGFEGAPKRARIGPLRTSATAAARAEELVADAHTPDGAVISDGVMRGAARALLTLRSLDVSLRPTARGAPEFGRVPIVGASVELDRRDGRVMTVSAKDGGDAAPALTITMQGPEQRDEVAMAIRQLALGNKAAAAEEPVKDGGIMDVPTDDEAEEE